MEERKRERGGEGLKERRVGGRGKEQERRVRGREEKR